MSSKKVYILQAVTWLRKEKDRAGQIHDFSWAVNKIHADFRWVWQGESGGPSAAESCYSGAEQSRLVEDNLRQLYIDTGPKGDNSSGYNSENTRPERISQTSLLTVDAMLRIKEAREAGSVVSDDGDLGSVCGGLQSPTVVETSPRDPPRDSLRSGLVTRTRAQLTYLLHMLLEAECLDWAGVLAIILRDVMALIRITNSAKNSSGDTSSRLYQGLQKLGDAYPQYSQFLTSVRPHILGLAPVSPVTSGGKTEASVRAVTPPSLSRSLSDPGSGGEAPSPEARVRRDSETAAEAARTVKSGTPSPGQRRTETVTDEVKQDVREVNDQENEEDDTGCILM